MRWSSLAATPLSLLSVLSLLAFAFDARAEAPRTHDGLYLRLGGGLGYMSNATDAEIGAVKGDGTIGGGAGAYELALGGTVAQGLVIGGGVYGSHAPSPKADSARFSVFGVGANDDIDFEAMHFVMVGPFIDYYFSPRGGGHLQGSIGFAYARVGEGTWQTTGARIEEHGANGVGVMLGGGYDWWVSDKWSLGILGRVTYGGVSGENDAGNVQWSDHIVTPALLFSATLH